MPKQFFQRLFKILAWVLGVAFFIVMAFFTKVDRKPYQESDYYESTFNYLDSLPFQKGKDNYLLSGWSKLNITPENPSKLAGYRPRGKYEFVQDSSFIRALIIQSGENTVAFLNYELMIIPPNLKNRVIEKIKAAGLPIHQTYFTATHTHSGLGGFMPGMIGKFAFGGFDKNLANELEEKAIEALEIAFSKKDTAQLIFQKHQTTELVANRLIDNDPVDPYVRQLIIQQKNGKKASLLSYSAHPTILNRKFMGLSGDYPHYLIYSMEADLDWASFAAGTVGSHKPLVSGNQIENVIQYSNSLFDQIRLPPLLSDTLKRGGIHHVTLPLHLRKAHYRIGKSIRIRPWVFNLLVGDTNPHFDIIQFGNILLVSSSGEISGVFMREWEKLANERGMHLMVTCFNGGYIGYITPDEYYDENLYEVRDMNWYGPYNGAFFDEILRKIITKSSP